MSDCVICGHPRLPDLRQSLVRWRPPRHPEYEHVVRCKDAAACRARLEAEGAPWPVVERRTP